MRPLELGDPLRGVLGPPTAKALEDGLGLRTVDDLLRHYPRKYAERGRLTDLVDLEIGEHVTVIAKIASAKSHKYRDRRTGRDAWRMEVVVTDGRGRLTLTFFRQKWREKDFVPGRVGMFAGKVGEFNGTRQLAQPDCQLFALEGDDQVDEVQNAILLGAAPVPVYPATALIPTWKIATALDVVLDQLPPDLADPIPVRLRQQYDLWSLRTALLAVHRPDSMAQVRQAQRRLKFDEALLMQTVLAQRRRATAEMPATSRFGLTDGILAAFERRLPFELTDGQHAIGQTLRSDLARSHPMHRLLQGEVGSGKTVVALRAMLTVVDSGGQAALLAPTEVLAQQHFRSITAMLGELAQRGQLGGTDVGTRVALVTGSMTAAARREALLDIGVGDAGIVIGTHALLEDRVQFFDLGLVVVDEQHRFGVEQRAALTAKSRDDARPHVLVMTATPIPRTVAMTVFGDLDVSTLTELPQGRAPIQTHVVPAADKPHFVERVWERITEEVAAGRQAYIVCPRIGDDEAPNDEELAALWIPSEEARAALGVTQLAPMLTEGPLAGLRVGVLHGRLPAEQKDEVMRRFAVGPDLPGGLDVLVATTVIEVGVDVPNATVMAVMDADRFGVSQLHQLRGRVGRGKDAGLCLLVTATRDGSAARRRLDAVAQTLDGFELSRLDLEQRREGDVLGVSQSGTRSSLRLLEVLHDGDVIEAAREAATALVENDPELRSTPALAAAVAAVAAEDRSDYLDKS